MRCVKSGASNQVRQIRCGKSGAAHQVRHIRCVARGFVSAPRLVSVLRPVTVLGQKMVPRTVPFDRLLLRRFRDAAASAAINLGRIGHVQVQK